MQILKLGSDDRNICKRLRLADGEPMATETAYLNYDICHPILEENLENNPYMKYQKCTHTGNSQTIH